MKRRDPVCRQPAEVRNTFLVCYDIRDDYRLRRVHKIMRGFGDHLQYSIFECQFTQTDVVRCRHALSSVINHREDQVLFVDLGPVEGRGDRVITSLGVPYVPFDSPCIIVDNSSGIARGRLARATSREEEEGE